MEELTLTKFDCLLLGTDLSCSITAAALSQSGAKILHLDNQSYYGSCDASLSMNEFLDYMQAPEQKPFIRKILHIVPVTLTQEPGHPCMDRPRVYNIDLQPRFLYNTGDVVDYMINSQVSQYIEFKAVESGIMWIDGTFHEVPCNKSQIFQDTRLSMIEKRTLMKFIETCKKVLDSEFDPDASFVEFMSQNQLSEFLQNVILYGLLLITRDKAEITLGYALGILQTYASSLGIHKDNSALLYPIYGAGDLPQGFSRMSAVFEGIYVVTSEMQFITLMRGDGDRVTGVLTPFGEMQAEFVALGITHAGLDEQIESQVKGYVQRAVLVSEIPIREAEGPVFYSIPPMSVGNDHPIYILQLGNYSNSTPEGYFLYHFYMETQDPEAGEQTLLNAISSLPVDNLLLCTYVQVMEDIKGSALHVGNSIFGFEINEHFVTFTQNQARKAFELVRPGGEFLPSRAENQVDETERILMEEDVQIQQKLAYKTPLIRTLKQFGQCTFLKMDAPISPTSTESSRKSFNPFHQKVSPPRVKPSARQSLIINAINRRQAGKLDDLIQKALRIDEGVDLNSSYDNITSLRSFEDADMYKNIVHSTVNLNDWRNSTSPLNELPSPKKPFQTPKNQTKTPNRPIRRKFPASDPKARSKSPLQPKRYLGRSGLIEQIKNFFGNIKEQVSLKKRIPDSLEEEISHMQNLIKTYKLTNNPPVAVQSLLSETLTELINISASYRRKPTDKLISNLKAIESSFDVSTRQQLMRIVDRNNYEKVMLKADQEIQQAISEISIRHFNSIKKIESPSVELVQVVTCVFSLISGEETPEAGGKVGSQAWKQAVKFLQKPGQAIKYLKSYPQLVRAKKVSSAIIKRATECLQQIGDRNLFEIEPIGVVENLLNFAKNAISYYDQFNGGAGDKFQVRKTLKSRQKSKLEMRSSPYPTAWEADSQSFSSLQLSPFESAQYQNSVKEVETEPVLKRKELFIRHQSSQSAGSWYNLESISGPISTLQSEEAIVLRDESLVFSKGEMQGITPKFSFCMEKLKAPNIFEDSPEKPIAFDVFNSKVEEQEDSGDLYENLYEEEYTIPQPQDIESPLTSLNSSFVYSDRPAIQSTLNKLKQKQEQGFLFQFSSQESSDIENSPPRPVVVQVKRPHVKPAILLKQTKEMINSRKKQIQDVLNRYKRPVY